MVNRLKSLLIKGLKETYIKDKYIFEHKLCERSKTFCIGIKLVSLLGEYDLLEYHVDSEYNKNIDNPKNFDGGKFSKYPDIIIHKRGRNNENYQDNNNLLIVEFKTPTRMTIDDFNSDYMKLKNFTSSRYSYRYLLGTHVYLTETGFAIKWYQEGEFQDGFEIYKYNYDYTDLVVCDDNCNFAKAFLERYLKDIQ